MQVIMIARLYAMYGRSKILLIFLVIIFLVVNIACGVMAAVILEHIVGEELILSGTYMCNYGLEGDDELLVLMFSTLNTVWEILVLCLSVWIAVKQLRYLRRLGRSTSSTIGECFRVLIQSHVLYFASFVGVYCLQPELLVAAFANSNSIGTQIIEGALQISLVMQMFVLGPRLILSVRVYHTKLLAESDAETSMASIVFQQRVHVSTSSTV
ncbi:hypothetical protein BD769DRAFT_1095802 [Suillus cothurnatus]|nr:hypothetical protein BD769DRAFT_1095802 [Suillus cothurnatus]